MRMIKVLDKGSCENQTLEGLAIGCASYGVSSCFGKFENPIIHGSELGAPVVPTLSRRVWTIQSLKVFSNTIHSGIL